MAQHRYVRTTLQNLYTTMDSLEAGFCNDLPKPYPPSNPSPSTFLLSNSTHPIARQAISNLLIIRCRSSTPPFRHRLRISALFPALYVLKDAFDGRTGIQSFQPRTQIKILLNKFHLNGEGVTTSNVMHPNQDPFSRARMPYLECSPPRLVKSWIIKLAKGWESVQVYRYIRLRN